MNSSSSPTWPDVAMFAVKVALLAVMLAAILLSYAYVAPAAGAITGIVTTLIGSIFLNFKGELPKPADAANQESK